MVTSEYATALGVKLRRIRRQRGLSLKDVERKSDGQWTAMVVGSYERADRAVTVTKLVELADFYGIPVSELLPDAWISVPRPAATAIVLDLQRLRELPTEHGALLARYVRSIEHQRGDYNGQVLSIRSEDLRSLAILYDRSPTSFSTNSSTGKSSHRERDPRRTDCCQGAACVSGGTGRTADGALSVRHSH